MAGVRRIVPPFGRGTRIRTRTNGFGDRCAAIDTIPLQSRLLLYTPSKERDWRPVVYVSRQRKARFWGARCKLNWDIEHIKSLPLTDTPVKNCGRTSELLNLTM